MVDEVSGGVGSGRDLTKQVTGLKAQMVKHRRVNGMRTTHRMMKVVRGLCCIGFWSMLVGRSWDTSGVFPSYQTLRKRRKE